MPITIPIAAPQLCVAGGGVVPVPVGAGGAGGAVRCAAARARAVREVRVAISNLLRVLKNLPSLGRFWFYPRRTPFVRVPPSLA